MSYGFEVYGDDRKSIIPKFGVLDSIPYSKGTVVKRYYRDSVLANEFTSGRCRILSYEFPLENPSMSEKPVQCLVAPSVGSVPADSKAEGDLLGLEFALGVAKADRDQTTAEIIAGITSIWNLAAAYGLQLWANDYGAPAIFEITIDGYFYAQYNTIYGDPNNFEPFRSAFRAAGGPYDQTYGKAGLLRTQVDRVTSLISDINTVPRTQGLSITCLGGNLNSRIVSIISGGL